MWCTQSLPISWLHSCLPWHDGVSLVPVVSLFFPLTPCCFFCNSALYGYTSKEPKYLVVSLFLSQIIILCLSISFFWMKGSPPSPFISPHMWYRNLVLQQISDIWHWHRCRKNWHFSELGNSPLSAARGVERVRWRSSWLPFLHSFSAAIQFVFEHRYRHARLSHCWDYQNSVTQFNDFQYNNIAFWTKKLSPYSVFHSNWSHRERAYLYNVPLFFTELREWNIHPILAPRHLSVSSTKASKHHFGSPSPLVDYYGVFVVALRVRRVSPSKGFFYWMHVRSVVKYYSCSWQYIYGQIQKAGLMLRHLATMFPRIHTTWGPYFWPSLYGNQPLLCLPQKTTVHRTILCPLSASSSHDGGRSAPHAYKCPLGLKSDATGNFSAVLLMLHRTKKCK